MLLNVQFGPFNLTTTSARLALYGNTICVHLTTCVSRLALAHQYVHLEALNCMSLERMDPYGMNFDLENNTAKKMLNGKQNDSY